MSGSRYTGSRQFRLPGGSGEKKAMRFRLYHQAQGLGVGTVVRTCRHTNRPWGLGTGGKTFEFFVARIVRCSKGSIPLVWPVSCNVSAISAPRASGAGCSTDRLTILPPKAVCCLTIHKTWSICESLRGR